MSTVHKIVQMGQYAIRYGVQRILVDLAIVADDISQDGIYHSVPEMSITEKQGPGTYEHEKTDQRKTLLLGHMRLYSINKWAEKQHENVCIYKPVAIV